MGKKLSEDQIKWILSLDASNAEQSIHKLENANKDLDKSNKNLILRMRELEAEGRKESNEYKQLDKTLKANNTTLKNNKLQIETLGKQMGLTNMTTKQLKNQAKDLQRQLENTSKNLHPDEYKKLEKELNATRQRMEELKNSGKNAKEALGNVTKGNVLWGTFWGNMATKAVESISHIISRIEDLASEGINMAASADGISRAYESLNRPELLDKLRTATKGTVNDLELMKATVQAKDFRIPFDDMGKYLQFAQLKAQQTGQSVEYMTQSIVTGLGRKSVLILDNLGLSAAEINEQLSKTGNFMEAVASIVDKQLAEAGGNYISEADKITQRTVQLQNAQIKLGKNLIPLKQEYDTLLRDAQIGILNLINWLVKNKNVILSVVAALTAFITTQKLAIMWTERHTKGTILNTIATKSQEIVMISARATTLLFAAAKAMLTGNITRATAAMKLFNTTTKMNPLVVLISLLIAAGAAFLSFNKRAYDNNNISVEANKNIQEEINKINNLRKTIHDSTKSYNERKLAIDEIQKIVPDYHVSLTKEGKLIKDNSEALDLYVKRLKLSAMTKIANTKLAEVQDQKNNYIEDLGEDKYRFYNVTMAMADPTKKFENESQAAASQGVSPTAYSAFKKKLENYDKEIEKYGKLLNEYTSDLFKSGGFEISTSDDTNKDPMSAELKKAENYYKNRLLKIKEQREKENLTDNDFNMINLLEEQIFYDKKLDILNRYFSKIKEADKKEDIKGQIIDVKSSKLDTNKKISSIADDNDIKSLDDLKKTRDKQLSVEEDAYKKLKLQFTNSLADQKITKEQYEALTLSLEQQELSTRLTIQREFHNNINNLELKNGKLKANAVEEAGQDVLNAEQRVADNRAQQAVKLASLLKDFKGEFNLFNQDEEQDIQLKSLEATYKIRYQMAKEAGLDTTALFTAFERAKTNILLKGEQERAGIRQQFGISSFQEEYELQQKLLDKQHEQGLLDDEAYEDAKLTGAILHIKKYFDYYAGLSTNAVQAIQQAELDQIDAKYDVEIEAAKGNVEETERLENEKAQKKLDVQKKYADVNFAIKIAQIIADTAVSIMQAFAQLGPIGGAIAAVFMGATGAAQIVSAKAERDKVKNMKLGSSTSASSSATGSRVITGKESGGFIDVTRDQDKKGYKARLDPEHRGYVDAPTVIVGEGPSGKSKEWIASNDALENQTIRPLIDQIDSAQRCGTVRTIDMNLLMRQRMAGFVGGGYINQAQIPSSSTNSNGLKNNENNDMMRLVSETRDLLLYLKKNGIKAESIWSLTEFEKKQKLKADAESIFTRNH